MVDEERFFHITALLNAELNKAHREGLSVTVLTNGYPIQLRENELAQIQVGINKCSHQWVEAEFLGRCLNGILTSPPDTYTICNLCWMTKS